MNSEAGASHVRKQSFHEDEYRAFRIALDVKETEVVDFWNNIDKLKSKKEFLRNHKDLENKIVKKKKPLQESRTNSDEKGAKDKKTKTKGRPRSSRTRGGNENICGSADMKENAPPTSENDSILKGGSTGAVKKKTNEKKTKKTDRRHASVTDATNTMHSGSDDVMREGKKSKGARVLAKKEKLTISGETGKMGEEKSKKKGKKEVEKSEIGSGKEISIDGDENQKSKAKWQVQFKEKKLPIKQKENLNNEEISSNPGIEEKDFGKEKKNVKKKTVESLNEECIEKKGDVIKRPRQRKEKTKNVPEVDGKDIEENKAKIEKKSRKKKVHFKDGEEKISKAVIKGKDAGNQETMIKKSKNKRNKAVEDADIEKVDDQKKATLSKKSRTRKTVKSTEPETKKKVLNGKEKKLVNQDKDKVNRKHDDKKNDDKIKIEAENIKSDHELIKSNAPSTHSGAPKEINYHSEKLNTVPINTDFKQEDLSSKKQLETTESAKWVNVENIVQSMFQKSTAADSLKNNECDFQDKNCDKPLLMEVIKNQGLFERKVNNSENCNKSAEDPNKSAACALVGKNKREKIEKTQTSYEFKQEVLRKLEEIHRERKMAKAVEKLSKQAMKHMRKLKLDSNSYLKEYLNLGSDSDSDSDTSYDSSESHSSDCSCTCSSVCSCSSNCLCSCCSDCEEYSDSSFGISNFSDSCDCSECNNASDLCDCSDSSNTSNSNASDSD